MNKDSRSDEVYKEADKRLKWLSKTNEGDAKERLAKLRHGIGSIPGTIPDLWGMLFDELPERMLGKYGNPSKAEWAIYDALTLYALHQQGNDPKTANMNVMGVSLGKAANRLVYMYGGTEDDRERVSRRFNQIALADDIEVLTYYLRTFIPLLRGEGIGLDYAMLARDIYLCQTESGQASVRLKWGQDYYSSNQDNEEHSCNSEITSIE